MKNYKISFISLPVNWSTLIISVPQNQHRFITIISCYIARKINIFTNYRFNLVNWYWKN